MPDPSGAERAEIERLRAEVERLATEGTPGVMHAVDKAFYDLTVQQRDRAWAEVERLDNERYRIRNLLDEEVALVVAARADAERLAEALWALLEWADKQSYHVPKSEEWYAARDCSTLALRQHEEAK